MALPERLAQLKYVIFSWQNTPLLKRDGLARDFFRTRATLSTLASSLGGFPLTLYEGTLPGPDSAPELWLSDGQCARLIALLAESMGPSRAHASWKPAAYHPRASLDRPSAPLVPRTFRSQADLEARFAELKDIDDWHATRTHWRELRRAQLVWAHLCAAGIAAEWVAVDVETWEMDHDLVTEVGLASLRLERDGTLHTLAEHYILEENASKRNGRYCPDARDSFQLGQSVTLPRSALTALLHARLHPRAEEDPPRGPVFLLLHDCRGDVKSLTALDVDLTLFERTPLLPDPTTTTATACTHVVGSGFLLDTQRLYSGWSRRKRQVRLEDAVRTLGVALPSGAGASAGEPLAFHNSGNDAFATLEVFRRLVEQSIGESPDEVRPPGWAAGGGRRVGGGRTETR